MRWASWAGWVGWAGLAGLAEMAGFAVLVAVAKNMGCKASSTSFAHRCKVWFKLVAHKALVG